MVKGEDSQLSGCGFDSLHRILDGCEPFQLKNNLKYGLRIPKKQLNTQKTNALFLPEASAATITILLDNFDSQSLEESAINNLRKAKEWEKAFVEFMLVKCFYYF